MKLPKFYILSLVLFITIIFTPLGSMAQARSVSLDEQGSNSIHARNLLQDEDPTPTATNTPTVTPTATETLPPPTSTPTQEPTSTPTQPSAGTRPVVVIASYATKPALVSPGKDFNLDIRLVNQGQISAQNIIVTIPAGSFVPRETGGVLAFGQLASGEKRKLTQPLTASKELAGTSVATLEMRISYTDPQGAAFNETFTIALNLSQPSYSGVVYTPTPTPTTTPVVINRAQLVISNYQTDVAPLQPGTRFALALQVFNAGNADAKRVTMIVGGASLPPSNGENDPLQPGNFSASGGEFTNFSPVGASNVQSLGDLAAGASLTAEQQLIVNVTTNPGAYSFKISFAYLDAKGNVLIDDQVISLLVFTLPVVEINFYRPADPFFVGQPGQLPLQIVNLSRKSFVFGNMQVSAQNAQLENNSIFIGTLDPGGYFPLDAMLIPNLPGSLELLVTVAYTDDFNQPQIISQVVSVEVMDAPPIDPGFEPGMGPGENPGGYPPEVGPETLWQKVLRFLAGLVGLDSARPTAMPDGGFPLEGMPSGSESGPSPVIIGPPLKGP